MNTGDDTLDVDELPSSIANTCLGKKKVVDQEKS